MHAVSFEPNSLENEKSPILLQGVRNVLLASLEDLEEMEHFLVSCNSKFSFISTQLTIYYERQSHTLLQGVLNILLASLKDMEEKQHFMASLVAFILCILQQSISWLLITLHTEVTNPPR